MILKQLNNIFMQTIIKTSIPKYTLFHYYFWFYLILFLSSTTATWVPYTSYTSNIPSYTYPVQLQAGDLLRGLLSWPGSQNLNLYLYSNGMDLLNRDTWVDRQYSAYLNPEDLVRTITTPGLYYLRVDFYSAVPTKYKFQIFLNGQLKGTYFDTLITVTVGRTVQQFEASGPCSIKVQYDGPIHNIFLFSPGTNVIIGAPFSSNTLSVNPKDITVTLSMAGLWNIVIHHGITSTTVLIPFKIVVYTNRGVNECTNYCSNIPYSAGIVSGYTSTCYCQDNFIWDDVNKVCIDCPSLNSTGIVGPKVAGTVDQCVCTDPNYSWSLAEMNCMLNCSLFPLTVSQNGLNSCNCVAGFKWDQATRTCIRNCSLISYTVGNDPSNTSECLCQPNLVWDPVLLICQVNCTAIQYATTATVGTTDRCQCQPGFYWDITSINCQINCTAIQQATTATAGTTDRCQCQSGFYWDSTILRCTIDCSLFNNVSSLPVSVLTVDQCQCDHPSFSWSATSFQCELNCSLVPNSETTAAGSPACACEANFEWDPILFTCDINCALVTHTINQTGRDSCNCIEGYEWSSLFLECVVNCSSALYALPASTMTQNTTEVCECQAGFVWILQPPSSYCAINCSEFDDAVSILSGSIDECVCRQKYIWNPNAQECVLNCSTIDYTLWVNSTSPTQLLNVNDSCLCEDKFIWNSVAEQCEVDCRALNNTSANVSSSLSGVMNGTVDECGCDAGLEWNITALECELMDQMPQIMQTQQADWLDGQVCSQTLVVLIQIPQASTFNQLKIISLHYFQANKKIFSSQLSQPPITITTTQSSTLQNSHLEVKLVLKQNIQRQQISLLIQDRRNKKLLLYPIQIVSKVAPALYSNDECIRSKKLSTFASSLMYIAYIVFGIGCFTSKIVGLELIGTLQIVYFSIASHFKDINLYIMPLLTLRMSNGNIDGFYNQNRDEMNMKFPDIFNSSFKINCYLANNHAMFYVAFAVFCFITLNIFIFLKNARNASSQVSDIQHEQHEQHQQQRAQNCKIDSLLVRSTRILKQLLICVIYFSSFPLSFFSTIFYTYCFQNATNPTILLISQILFYLLPLLVIIFCLQFVTAGNNANNDGQFRDLFKNNCLCRMYVPISILYRITIATIMAYNIENMYGTLFVLFFSIGFVMFNMINLPFSSPLHNYRAMCIHVTQLVTLVVANYYRSMKANTGLATKSHLHMPAYIIYVGLGISALLSISCTIVQTIIRIKRATKKGLEQQNMRQIQKEQKKNKSEQGKKQVYKNVNEIEIQIQQQVDNKIMYKRHKRYRNKNRNRNENGNGNRNKDIGKQGKIVNSAGLYNETMQDFME